MDAVLDAIRAVVGAAGLLTDIADTAPYAEDWRRLYQGRTPAVVRPADTEQLAAVMRLCSEHRIAVVPQGGNTSMVAGATPDADNTQIVVSTSRMNRVRAIDPVDLTMTVEAGVTLKAAQLAAAEADCLLPLSISSEGSAQIGGVLATNAGGNNTLRFGNARDLVLGLEVVLADGTVWNGLRHLHKDNTGYCLRQLFVGSEGTLGIITAAVLRLQPGVRARVAALCAVPSTEAALEEALAAEEITDAAIAGSGAQRAAIWKLREEHAEAQKREGASVKNDVSVPVSRVPELIRRATAACEALMPGIRVVPFGHLGDGNIHFNLEQPVDMDAAAFLARDHEIMDAVGEVVRDLDGSFSAEHGVGKLKPYMMPLWRGGAELDAMQRIKRALDPQGLLNPGKVLP